MRCELASIQCRHCQIPEAVREEFKLALRLPLSTLTNHRCGRQVTEACKPEGTWSERAWLANHTHPWLGWGGQSSGLLLNARGRKTPIMLNNAVLIRDCFCADGWSGGGSDTSHNPRFRPT